MRREAESVLVNFVTSNIVRLAEKYTRHGEKFLKQTGQINLYEWRTLVWLERTIEPTFEDLAPKIGVSQETFAEVVNGLVKRGLVVRLDEEQGHVRFGLTEAGDALFDTVYPVMEKRQRMLVEDEDPDEMALLMDMLHRLEAKVDAEIEAKENS